MITTGSRAARSILTVGLLVVAFVTVLPASELQASETGTRWNRFSESSNCGSAYTKTPYATKRGSLSDSEMILGPFGSYFGRSIAEVRSQLIWWQVPFSGGTWVKVHREALPAFNYVSQLLSAEAAKGRVYFVEAVSSFVPRTIGGSHQISRHSLGISIDINYIQNPYRRDGVLITDMPDWYVDVWKAAGFCWGGDWRYSKDPMHFSWNGPGSASALDPLSPRTSASSFGSPVETRATVMGSVLDRYLPVIGDGIGNGAPDVLGIRDHVDGAVMDMASGSEAYGECAVRRWFLPDDSILAADHLLMADVDGDTGDDLVAIELEGSPTALVATGASGFEDLEQVHLSVSSGIVATAGADFDDDHIADLWLAFADGTLKILAGPSFGTTLHASVLPSGAPSFVAASDRHGGDTPEIFAVYSTGGSGLRLEVLNLGSDWEVEQSLSITGPLRAVGAMDYDGDGRADFVTLGSDGNLRAYVGNTSTGTSPSRWFINPDYECDDPIVLDFRGAFYDDDESVHESGIEFIAGERITEGCNPPFNDRFCPDATLTRAQAAAFVARALRLADPGVDYFDDDDGHVLEGAVNRIAAMGITEGCDALARDFCPNRQMTRAEFAAFLSRSLGLKASNVDHFSDDDGHVLESAINRLAEAGITQGCNPPENDMFCPGAHLTRAQAATFFARAFR